jgi:hypothetical protein
MKNHPSESTESREPLRLECLYKGSVWTSGDRAQVLSVGSHSSLKASAMLVVDKIIENRCNVLIGSVEVPLAQRYNLIHNILKFERVNDYWEVMLTKSSCGDIIL